MSTSSNTSLVDETDLNSISVFRDNLFPESLEYNPNTEQFLLSSLTEGTIFSTNEDGNVSPFIEDERFISTVGVAINEEQDRLYIANSDVGVSLNSSPETEFQLAALGIFKLSTGEPIDYVDLSSLSPGEPHFANDIDVDDEGNAYITDSFSPIIYKVSPEGNPSILLEDEQFAGEGFNLNGIVAHPDDFLIVADSNDGLLYKVPLDSPEEFTQVKIDRTLVNADGLLLTDEDDLVVITNDLNGESSNRVFNLHSRDNWESAEIVDKLDVGDEAFLTSATIEDENILVLDAQLDRLFAGETSDKFPILTVGSRDDDAVPTFSKIYVFGDSLSDPGNILKTTTSVQPFREIAGLDIPVIPPSPPYFEGRFSNGPTWVENLAEDLELTITPSTELSVFSPELALPSSVTLTSSGLEVSPFFNGATTTSSVNFAFGGAQTGENGAGEIGDFIPGVLTQVEWFVNDHQQAEQLADPNALYIVWAGPNDYQTVPDADPEKVVDNLETSIKSLFALGASNFLIPNLPDLGKTPFAQTPERPVSPDTLTSFSREHNLLLDETLDELSGSLNGINLIPLDTDELFNNIRTNPEEFGLTNVSEPCLNSDPVSLAISSADPDSISPGICDRPDEHLFWDLLHPAASAHEILGEFALETLTTQSELVFS